MTIYHSMKTFIGQVRNELHHQQQRIGRVAINRYGGFFSLKAFGKTPLYSKWASTENMECRRRVEKEQHRSP